MPPENRLSWTGSPTTHRRNSRIQWQLHHHRHPQFNHASKTFQSVRHEGIIWRKGSTNMADYFTKHHPPWYHKIMRWKYLHKALLTRQAETERGCATHHPATTYVRSQSRPWRKTGAPKVVSSCHWKKRTLPFPVWNTSRALNLRGLMIYLTWWNHISK